ncbi:hypothetical protein, partial [Frankia sp. AgW1.1]|uniref:hypothetical protein n=1 Tax=Frankia sp. AgW1.1 TaxID=1836971 RepID=UPI001EE4743B
MTTSEAPMQVVATPSGGAGPPAGAGRPPAPGRGGRGPGPPPPGVRQRIPSISWRRVHVGGRPGFFLTF